MKTRTIDWLKIFYYEEKEGKIFWNSSGTGRRLIRNVEAGGLRSDKKYKSVTVFGKRFYVHRIIWEIHNDDIPNNMFIDHIDGNGFNNKISNLRLVTRQGNARNVRRISANKSGITGVYWNITNKKWVASIVVTRKSISLGNYNNIFDAACARLSANKKYGFHENHGKERF